MQTTQGFALLTIATVLTAAVVALGQVEQTSVVLVSGAAGCGVAAVTWTAAALVRRIAPPPWPYGSTTDGCDHLEAYIARTTVLADARAGLLQTGTALLVVSATLTLLSGASAL